MKLKIFGRGGHPSEPPTPDIHEHIPCAFHNGNQTFIARCVVAWPDGVETPACAAHELWVREAYAELNAVLVAAS